MFQKTHMDVTGQVSTYIVHIHIHIDTYSVSYCTVNESQNMVNFAKKFYYLYISNKDVWKLEESNIFSAG